MPIALAMQAQITAIKARIDALAPTATPEDIVMLSKAIEAIGGQCSVFDVMQVGADQAAAILAAGQTQITSIQNSVGIAQQTALAAVTVAQQAALAELNPQNFSRAAVHAALLSL